MIQAESDPQNREEYLQRLMELPNQEGPVEEIFAAQVAASPPFFHGSPLMRVANLLIRDDRFGCEKPTCASP